MTRNLIGARVRECRKAVGLTQAGLAARVGISPSYLNLIEGNRRNIGGSLLKRLADELKVPLDRLDGAAERRLIDDLAELALDPLLAELALDPNAAGELAARQPAWARALLQLHRVCVDRGAAVTALSDRLNQDPLLADAVHGLLTHVSAIRSAAEILEADGGLDEARRARFVAIIAGDSRRLSDVSQALADFFTRAHTHTRSITPAEEVDDFILAHENHFPSLEAAAERLHAAIASAPDGDGEGSNRFVQARQAAEQLARAEIDAEVASAATLTSEAARQRAALALAAYVAAAVLMPYEDFHAAATDLRYDIDRLATRFDCSFEQVCHRLATLRRPQREGVRFGFLRANAAGHLQKRLPLPRLPLPRYGAGCPLWPVYAAFQSPGVLRRQLVELPGGERYLMVARAVEKGQPAYGQPRQLISVMLICDALHADRLVYGDGLDLSPAAPHLPVGTTCRVCTRRECRWRQEDPIIDAGLNLGQAARQPTRPAR